jgi:hypothetical protein
MKNADHKIEKPIHRFSGQARVKLAITGVVLPALALLFSMGGPLAGWPAWQSGEAKHYAAMLLTWPGFGAFLPLVLFSMLSLLVWLWRDRMLKHWVVRLGLYTGFVLTVQFLLILIIAESGWALLIAAAIFAAFQAATVWASAYAIRNARRFSIRYLLIVTAFVAIVIALLKTFADESNVMEMVLGIPLIAAIAAPILSLVTMTRASVHAVQTGQSQWFERTQIAMLEILLGWTGWFVCYFVAWKIAVDVMLAEYAKLPTTQPGCYVCSAAAHGHAWLVRSEWVDGIGMPVNDQLRRLKFLEIALKVATPRLHRQTRLLYDHHGPKLAGQCRRSRWFADSAFVILLPIELIAIIIRITFRYRASQIESLYRLQKR